MNLEDRVYTFGLPGKPDHVSGIGVPLDFSSDLCGLFFDFPTVVAPSIFMQEMGQAFGQADFRYFGNGFKLGFVTNMRIQNPTHIYPFDKKYEQYHQVLLELLQIRSEIRPSACLSLHYDSKKGYWLYEKIHPEIPLDTAFSSFEDEKY